MKSSAEVAASAASKVMTMAPSSPVAASRRNLSRSLESWNSGVLRPQEQPRMRREGQRRGLAAERLGALERGADHGAMAAMHAVEIADRHHGAVQRPLDAMRTVAHDMKGFARRVRACHRNAGDGRISRSGYVLIFGHRRPFGPQLRLARR